MVFLFLDPKLSERREFWRAKVGNNKYSCIPGNRIRSKVFNTIILPKELHPQDCEDVDDDEEDEGQVPQGPQGRYNNTQENLHCGPGLR